MGTVEADVCIDAKDVEVDVTVEVATIKLVVLVIGWNIEIDDWVFNFEDPYIDEKIISVEVNVLVDDVVSSSVVFCKLLNTYDAWLTIIFA